MPRPQRQSALGRGIRRGCLDDEMWQQEYCCAFLSIAAQWISPELFEANVSPEANGAYPPPEARDLYIGWDIARNKHLSVIWATEMVGDVSWTRGIVEFRDVPTPTQIDEIRPLIRRARRVCVDNTGMGLSICETLQREFGNQVEGVTFTLPVKEELAVKAKRHMEEMKCRLPDSDVVRGSFRSVKKLVTPTGHFRFDAEADEKYGRADHWWAFCLVESAEGQPMTLGLVEYLKQQLLRRWPRPRS